MKGHVCISEALVKKIKKLKQYQQVETILMVVGFIVNWEA